MYTYIVIRSLSKCCQYRYRCTMMFRTQHWRGFGFGFGDVCDVIRLNQRSHWHSPDQVAEVSTYVCLFYLLRILGFFNVAQLLCSSLNHSKHRPVTLKYLQKSFHHIMYSAKGYSICRVLPRVYEWGFCCLSQGLGGYRLRFCRFQVRLCMPKCLCVQICP